MDFSNLKFRCSSLGHIMSDPIGKTNLEKYEEARIKNDEYIDKIVKITEEYNAIVNKETVTAKKKREQKENIIDKALKFDAEFSRLRDLRDVVVLSQSCKTHLMDLFVVNKYGRVSDIKSKYLEKGILNEGKGITDYSLVKEQMFEKNIERREDDWISGEMDFSLEEESCIFDTKISWDIFTFYRQLGKVLDGEPDGKYFGTCGGYYFNIDPIYWWQGQGYLKLWGKKYFKLVYVLTDVPEKFIEKERSNFMRDFFGTKDDFELACQDIINKYTYQDIPREEKIIEFTIERNDDAINSIPARANACREFLNKISKIKTVNYELENEH